MKKVAVSHRSIHRVFIRIVVQIDPARFKPVQTGSYAKTVILMHDDDRWALVKGLGSPAFELERHNLYKTVDSNKGRSVRG